MRSITMNLKTMYSIWGFQRVPKLHKKQLFPTRKGCRGKILACSIAILCLILVHNVYIYVLLNKIKTQPFS